jgi:hypothetical protein
LGVVFCGFFGLGEFRLTDLAEVETEGEWSAVTCRRGGVKDITRERGGESVDSAGF